MGQGESLAGWSTTGFMFKICIHLWEHPSTKLTVAFQHCQGVAPKQKQNELMSTN